MTTPLLVMKFGGTSVGSAEAIERAARLAAETAENRRCVVVSSAMSKVTDALLQGMQAESEESLRAVVAELERKHVETAEALLPADRIPDVEAQVRSILERYSRIARGMVLLNDRPPRAVDEAVSAGEKLSCLLLAETIRGLGRDSEVVDGGEVIVTDDTFGAASPLMEQTAAKATERLSALLENGVAPVVTGFNGATERGESTTLGRGGSDFSASILAAALDAEAVWIWTDVDGILTGDPRIVPTARVLPQVTYNEAAELAYAGAKVLHPRTLQPVASRQIPVWIKNSFRPELEGTRIGTEISDARGVRAITSLPHVTLISIEAASLTQSGAQLISRALAAAARAGVEVLLLTRSSFRQNFSMLVRTAEVGDVLVALRQELALELAHGYVLPIGVDPSVGLLAVVGEGMRGTSGLAGRLFTAISAADINIIAIAQGSSELTISIVIRQDRLEDAVRAVHEDCRLGESCAVAVR